MNDRPIARHGLGGLDPHIFLEIGWDAEVDVGDNPLSGDVIGFGKLENDVWLADRPAFGKCARGRAALGIAQRRALIDPGQERGRSWVVRLRSLTKWPYRGSACQGGIRRSSTTSRIIAECFRASS